MKILSKKGSKDYYDFLTGIYGEDPKIVLDRRGSDNFVPTEKKIINLYICDYLVQGYYYSSKYYWGKQLLELTDESNREEFLKGERNHVYISKEFQDQHTFSWREDRYINILPIKHKDTMFNTTHKCAIAIESPRDTAIRYPKLDKMNISSIISPHNIYMMLSEWLAPKEDHKDTRTNSEKIISQGFDLTHSFRNTK